MTHTAHSIAYYQELVASQAHIINYERDRRKQLEDTIANRNLPLNMRQATLAIKKLVDTSSPDENGWYRAHLPRLADSGGSSASTMSRALRNFAECTGAIELHKVPDTHDPYKEILYIKPTDLLDRPADIIPLKDIKRHGGDHRVFCDACGSEDLIERKKQVCRSCGNVVKEFASVNNSDIILKSARVKLPSWGAWDIHKATWLLWSRCMKEEPMLALEERFMIREMYRKGISISEIARRTGRDRKTIRQVVNAPELAPAKHPRQAKACKIDPYAPYLERRMAEGVFNARKLYGERKEGTRIGA